jgi:hypothetical protein
MPLVGRIIKRQPADRSPLGPSPEHAHPYKVASARTAILSMVYTASMSPLGNTTRC